MRDALVSVYRTRGRCRTPGDSGRWPNAHLVHVPVHASWLNQVEIYFSVIQRKVLTPNDFADLAEVEARLLAFERRYEQTATPFERKVHPQRSRQAHGAAGWQA